MPHHNKVSCLICTYNAEQYIDATLVSVVHQTLGNLNDIYISSLEILIWDDGSTDRTLDILSQRAKKDSRIQLFLSTEFSFDEFDAVKRGPYGGLNFLLEHAKGDYIAIQDHDDLRHPEKLIKQVKFLNTHPTLVGCGTKTLMRYESDHNGFLYFLGEKSSYTIHPSLVFRTTAKFRYPDRLYMNDALFQKKVLCKGEKKIGNIDETLTFHRVRAGTKNYSYSWFKLTKQNIQTIFYIHPLWYACFALVWEMMRKVVYPVIKGVKCGKVIDKIERLPFILMGKKVEKWGKKRVEEMGFYM